MKTAVASPLPLIQPTRGFTDPAGRYAATDEASTVGFGIGQVAGLLFVVAVR